MRARPGWVNEAAPAVFPFLLVILIMIVLFSASAVAHKIRSTIKSMSMKKRWTAIPFRLDTKPDLFHSQAVRETDLPYESDF
jgi:hypothetical protein